MNKRENKKGIILEAAQTAYIEEGSQFSLRTVTKLADVNVAAVNYYFGSKAKLLEALAGQIIKDLDTRQLDALENVPEETVRNVVKAFVDPFFDLYADSRHSKKEWKMLGRLLTDTDADTREIFNQKIKHVDQAYLQALSRLQPRLSVEERYFRYANMIGTVVTNISQLLPNPETNPANVREWMITYITGAFEAPPS